MLKDLCFATATLEARAKSLLPAGQLGFPDLANYRTAEHSESFACEKIRSVGSMSHRERKQTRPLLSQVDRVASSSLTDIAILIILLHALKGCCIHAENSL